MKIQSLHIVRWPVCLVSCLVMILGSVASCRADEPVAATVDSPTTRPASHPGAGRVRRVLVQTQIGKDQFVHPGLLHTQADFERMRTKVAQGASPWIEGWKLLIDNPRSQLTYRPRPTTRVVRGNVPGNNVAQFFTDVHAAYQLAVRWKVSGDEAYAKKAVEILNAWSTTLKEVTGNSDRFLASGIYGAEIANAAEIMRSYDGWSDEDFAGFQQMMLDVFYPMNHDFLTRHNGAAITNYWCNWDASNMSAMLAIGVLCDRRDIYNEAVEYFRHGKGNGAMDKAVYYMHPGYLGQWQESGRDQGHNTLCIALMAPFCEMAWNQGDDLYGYDNNRFLAGCEYVAKYNLGNDVPFQLYAWGNGQRGEHREQPVIATGGRGAMRPTWEMIVNHYVNRKGLAAPFSEQAAEKIRPEGGAGGHASTFDQLGFGTLLFTREAGAKSPAPVGLTARKSGESIVLSWWNAAGATSCAVKRSTRAAGPYETIASDIKDVFTYCDNPAKPGEYFYIVTALRDGRETAPSNQVSVRTEPTLFMHLTFDQIDAGSVVDTVDPSRRCTPKNGPTIIDGKFGRAIALDGKDDHIELPAGLSGDLADFTVAAWVNLDSSPPWARLFDFGDDRGRGMFLTLRDANAQPRFVTGTTFRHNEQALVGDETIATGQWVHVAVTLSGRVGTIYINGRASGSNPAMDFPPYQIGRTSRNWIGRSQFENDPYFAGRIDDFRIYDGALSAAQVAELAGK